MQRIFNVDKWSLLEDGKSVSFGKVEPRRVRLHVNAPDPAKLFYSDPDGTVTFLARVLGRDVVEFGAYGEFSLTAEGGDIWFDTVDGEDISFSIPDAVIITKITERRARNPELEMMQYMMNRNIQRRLDAQRDELVQLWARQQAVAAAAAAKPEAEGGGAGAAAESESSSSSDDGAGDDAKTNG